MSACNAASKWPCSRRTRRYARPPRRIPQIPKAIAVEAMFLHTRIEALFRNYETRACAELVSHLFPELTQS
jgi:hypothetical protein